MREVNKGKLSGIAGELADDIAKTKVPTKFYSPRKPSELKPSTVAPNLVNIERSRSGDSFVEGFPTSGNNVDFKIKNAKHKGRTVIDGQEYAIVKFDRMDPKKNLKERCKFKILQSVIAVAIVGAGVGYVLGIGEIQLENFEQAYTVVRTEEVDLFGHKYGIEIYQCGDALWVNLETGDKFKYLGKDSIDAREFAVASGYVDTAVDTDTNELSRTR